MSRLMVFSVALWLTTFVCAAVGAHQVDALVALGSERFTVPLYSGLLALVPLLVWHPLVYVLARKWRRLAMLHVLVPLAMSGLTVVTLGLAPKLGPAEVVAASGEHDDIVLITLDTYRADHVGALGGKGRRRRSTPSPPPARCSPRRSPRHHSPRRHTPACSPASRCATTACCATAAPCKRPPSSASCARRGITPAPSSRPRCCRGRPACHASSTTTTMSSPSRRVSAALPGSTR